MTKARYGWLIMLFLLLTGCVPASSVPIATVPMGPAEKGAGSTLIVFLPGRFDTVRSFETEGLVSLLYARHPGSDSLGVEAHLGYYRDRSILVRLREDVIQPAQRAGYRDIWLVGVSMGGLGALLYDSTYPGDLRGVVALAPYLGEGTLLEEITRSGGVGAWRPGTANDPEREIWQRLSAYSQRERSEGRIYLGYGTNDRFAGTNRFFAGLLPAEQVVEFPGGHDWETWRALWGEFIKRLELRAGPGKIAGAMQ